MVAASAAKRIGGAPPTHHELYAKAAVLNIVMGENELTPIETALIRTFAEETALFLKVTRHYRETSGLLT